jgi:hypothetical protein
MTHADLDALAFRLFKLFAQYEYALKVMGYVKAGKSGQVEPDWDRFANSVGAQLLEMRAPKVVAAIEFLFNTPPKRQVFVNNQLEWRDVDSPDRSAQSLFGHIRRVRNNLYHGGKFNERWFAPDRSRTLIEHTLVLLDALAKSNEALREAIRKNAA